MRQAIQDLQLLGRMPTESLADDEGILATIEAYDQLLQSIEQPISLAEAEVLVALFPEGFFYDLHWDLIRLVESVLLEDEAAYLELINHCPSQEWQDLLQTRHQNWKEKQTKML